MKTIKLKNGDIDFINKSIQLIDGKERVDQLITNLLNIKKSELFNNKNVGLDHEVIFNSEATEKEVKNEILRVIGDYAEINEINVDVNRIERTIKVELKLIYNDEVIESEVTI